MSNESSAERFEDALIALNKATDSRGLYVILYSGDNSVLSLQRATKRFADLYINDSTAFLSYLEPGYTKASEMKAAAAYWRNLSLLANATAAACEAASETWLPPEAQRAV